MPIVYDDTHDSLGRFLIDSAPCAVYGMYKGAGWEFPYDKPVPDDYPYVPINFLQINDVYVISSQSVVQNSKLISTWNSPFDVIDNLNSILLNRNGPYGFCTWKQLDYHANNRDARDSRKQNQVTVTTDNDDEYVFTEGPLASFSLPSMGKIKFIEKAGADFVEVGAGEIVISFSNEMVQFENDELFDLVKVPPIVSTSFANTKEIFKPTKPENKTGNTFDYKTKKEIVLYQGNPERRILEKTEIARVKYDGSGIIDYLWYGETIFPNRLFSNTKAARVRDEILSIEDWRTGTDDLEANYQMVWRGNKADLLRADTAENSQYNAMDITETEEATLNRWPLFSYKNGDSTDIIFPIDPTKISEAGELLGSGITFSDLVITYNSLWYTFLGKGSAIWAETLLEFNLDDAAFCDPLWRTHQQSGKFPFYSNIEGYMDNVFPHSKGYSLIPEWSVSKNLITILQAADCEIFGSSETEETFGDCDFYALGDFKKEVGELTKQKSIKFVVDTFKKFIPYRGFYPADRSVQIGTLLNDSYFDSIFWPDLSTPGEIALSQTDGAYQTFLSYLMAPGIFFNTIKSGFGVGFPVFTSAKNLTSTDFKFCEFSYLDDSGAHDLWNFCYITAPSFYLPFETLLDVKKNLMPVIQKTMASHDMSAIWTAPYQVAGQYYKTPGEPDWAFAFDATQNTLDLFERANHNFLSEVERFYLKNRTNTHFISKPESEFKEMVAGSIYYMDVVLKQRDCVMTEGPAYSTGNSLRGLVYGGQSSMSSTLPQVIDDFAGADAIDRISDITDPAFGPFCPPCFYGAAVARISFDPLDADPDLAIGQSRKFTLDEILKHAQIRTLKHTNTGGALEHSGVFWAYPGADDSIGDFNGLYHEIDWSAVLDISGNSHTGDVEFATRDAVVPFASTILQSGMMDIDQSVELYNKKALYNYEVNKSNSKIFSNKTKTLSDKEFCWCINTKFETPILDFSMHTRATLEAMPAKSGGVYPYQQYAERTRGMWLDYGALPRDGSGVFLEIRESFPHKVLKNQKIVDYDNNILKNVFAEDPAITLYFDAPYYQYLNDGDDIDITCHVVANFDGVLDIAYQDPLGATFNIEYTVGGVSAASISVQKGVVYDVHFTGKMTYNDSDYRNCKFEWADDTLVYSEKIKFEVEYTVPGALTNGVNVTLTTAASSVNKVYNFIVAGTYNQLLSKYNDSFDLQGNTIPKFESLIDVCGFEVGERRIGEIAEEREIKEAIVVVPYIEVNGEREYFEIDKTIMEQQKKSLQDLGYAYKTIYGDIIEDTTITKLLQHLENYVFPPQFDFVKNTNIDPMVMYVTEFKRMLTQDDLIDLWQNLLPDNLKAVENEKVTIEHDLEEYEFFHGQEIPDDIKFLVFKVKQKGAWNYFDVKPNVDDVALTVAKNNSQSYSMVDEQKYNYNWPYDFCSIIEYGKVDCHIKFDGI